LRRLQIPAYQRVADAAAVVAVPSASLQNFGSRSKEAEAEA